MASKMIRGERWVGDHSSKRGAIPSLDNTTIAELPIGLIACMSRDELVGLIREAQLPLVDARTLRRLPFMDRPALERLAHMARRCCRTRTAQTRRDPEFSNR
jgi:hypothetical protein